MGHAPDQIPYAAWRISGSINLWEIIMELSLSQLALLIELTEVELAEMKKIIEDKNADDDLINDSSEHSLQLLAMTIRHA